MNRLIPMLLLLFLPTTVFAEPIHMRCKNLEKPDSNPSLLYIDLDANKAQYGGWKPIEIYFKDDKYIVWIGNSITDVKGSPFEYFILFVFFRETGILKTSWMELSQIGEKRSAEFEQCFKPI